MTSHMKTTHQSHQKGFTVGNTRCDLLLALISVAAGSVGGLSVSRGC